MGMLFCDGFDGYSVSADLARNWVPVFGLNTIPFVSNAGRLGGGALQNTGSQTALRYINAAAWNWSTAQTGVFGFWMKMSAAPAAISTIFRLVNNANTTQASVRMLTNGLLAAYDQSETVQQAVGITNVADNLWHWVEFRIGGNYNGGQLGIGYVDGLQNWASSANPGSVSTTFALLTPATQTITYDDIYVYDNTTLVNPQLSQFPIGPQYITYKRPSADSSVQFAPDSGGTNFNRVNETVPDGDTSYVQSATVGNADEYTYGALGFTPVSVTSTMLSVDAKNPGAGTVNLKVRCHSGATTSDSTAAQVSSNYNVFRRVFDQDPNTSAAWTGANLDSAKFGQVVA